MFKTTFNPLAFLAAVITSPDRKHRRPAPDWERKAPSDRRDR